MHPGGASSTDALGDRADVHQDAEPTRLQGAAVEWSHRPGVLFVRVLPVFPGVSAGNALWAALVGAGSVSIGLVTGQDMLWIAGCTILSVSVIMWLMSRAGSRSNLTRGSALLARVKDRTWEERAERAIITASMNRAFSMRQDRRVGLDTALWFGEPPEGLSVESRPSTILCNIRPELSMDGEDLSEQVEVGAARRLRAADRKRRIIGLMALVVGMTLLFYAFRVVGLPPYLWLIFFGAQAGMIVYRLGWGPIQINSAVASIGRLDVARWGVQREHTTSDSVLIVTTLPGTSISGAQRGTYPVLVHAMHRGGRRTTLIFDTMQDPGLSDLLRRWIEGHPSPPPVASCLESERPSPRTPEY